ncbi:protein kinase C-binding protein NELL2-like [Scleropages formosus]|uniref:protein kinase C-binding protein NELL2-like n=1 Tax=Scleropages formosus TaxID=113540 RepID=UPI0010FA6C85|nr:protein kinase C-binding protein NELL2-like [Scleropages formosus]
MGELQLFTLLCASCVVSALRFAPDPDPDPALHIDVFAELHRERASAGLPAAPGFLNQSRAFLFQDAQRNIKLSDDLAQHVWRKLRGRKEFTVLVTLKQERYTSGVILSIRHEDQRFLELESSGQHSEVRFHYVSQGNRTRTETFPYALADGRWHKVSITLSSSHIQLHVDCHRVYERAAEPPAMELPAETTLWLGQRSSNRGLFKGMMQGVELLVMPQGYLSQCPDLNRTCPTCNDFHALVQKIMELQDVLAKTSRKLALAEDKMANLDRCYCERTCDVRGALYRDGDAWTDGCKNCSCTNGTVRCESLFCPPAQCPPDSAPVFVNGSCCRECQPVCLFGGRAYVEGDRKAVHHPSGMCSLFECRDRKMNRVEPPGCPELNCLESEQMTLTDRCCRVCPGHDFCSEGHGCAEHSDCVNLEAGACCGCKDGFRPLRADEAYCEDIDECAEGRHYCRENTACVNTLGSFSCICHAGYVRIDDYSCAERDECQDEQNGCDENALCFNTVQGHRCSCKPGYAGNGTFCKALCEGRCRNGGTCISENTCICQQGFTGKMCETDIDECSDGFVECDSRATCVNLPGWYHCECRDGYHDNGMFSPNGDSCQDIDECESGRNSCSNDTVCFNLEGGYDCRCPHGHNCSGDCIHGNRVKHNGQIWVLESDRCSVCSCQTGLVLCRRMVCDCDNPTVDLFCCPECDLHLSSQCLHRSTLRTYNSGDTWVDGCRQCQCLRGEVDCWPLACPPVDCEFSAVPHGECCPRCAADPREADVARNDIASVCTDEQGATRLGGASWTKHGSECTICRCKNGRACCSTDPLCL